MVIAYISKRQGFEWIVYLSLIQSVENLRAIENQLNCPLFGPEACLKSNSFEIGSVKKQNKTSGHIVSAHQLLLKEYNAHETFARHEVLSAWFFLFRKADEGVELFPSWSESCWPSEARANNTSALIVLNVCLPSDGERCLSADWQSYLQMGSTPDPGHSICIREFI